MAPSAAGRRGDCAPRGPCGACRCGEAASVPALAKPRRPNAAKPASADGELCIVLANDRLQRRLNHTFRGADKSTNVLSFEDGERGPGDVVLALETIAREAKAQGKSLADHLAHLVVHGVLHLMGYDHEKESGARAHGTARGKDPGRPCHCRSLSGASGKTAAAGMSENDNDDSGPAGRLRSWLKLKRKDRKREEALRDVIEEIIEEAGAEGEAPKNEEPMTAGERGLLLNIIRLRDLTARDVKVPRADIIAVAENIGFDELLAELNAHGHSRLPVYRESLDDVIGFIHIKDLIAARLGGRPFDLKSILRQVLFVAPSMRVLDLLLQMRLSRQHLALVIDEFGGTDGLITIEDLVEQIVGEIEDEHDIAEGPKLSAAPRRLADRRCQGDDRGIRGSRRPGADRGGARSRYRHIGRA